MIPTKHRILYQNANNLSQIEDKSVQLMITSPPYPMIEMWDEIFSKQNPNIKEALVTGCGSEPFELMHQEMDKVWNEIYRVLQDGGIACINIGDATRTINGNFQLFNNHSRIINHCLKIGFQTLPAIIWRKQTNAPNKFMGSGMLSPGAYVTLEHEYILVFRKGEKRPFEKAEEKENRRESAYFWEERNSWFSDIWMDLKGTTQKLNHKELRGRSGAYPFELAYRLINMFSVKGDTVVDPFLGTGTTTIAAVASERNSIGIEISEEFSQVINDRILFSKDDLNEYIINRIEKHLNFVKEREEIKGSLKYENPHHCFPIMTRQELNFKLRLVEKIEQSVENEFSVFYSQNLAEITSPPQMQLSF